MFYILYILVEPREIESLSETTPFQSIIAISVYTDTNGYWIILIPPLVFSKTRNIEVFILYFIYIGSLHSIIDKGTKSKLSRH